MSKKYPDWFILIKHWVDRGGQGYTLPFLVGARLYNKGIHKSTKEEVRKLLEEIFNNPVKGNIIQLTWCNNLSAVIFGLQKEEIPGKQIKSDVTEEDSVFVRNDLLKFGNNTKEIINNLTEEYWIPIKEGLYSRNIYGNWVELDEDEIFRIDNLLKK
jgi:hypothetical protein